MSETKILSAAASSMSDPQAWLAASSERFGAEEQRVIERAVALARAELGNVVLDTGEPAIDHALYTAATLAQLNLDHESVAAGLLLALAPAGNRERERLVEKVGAAVVALVEGTARGQIDTLGASMSSGTHADAQLEGLRKMLLAMVQQMFPDHSTYLCSRHFFYSVSIFFFQE